MEVPRERWKKAVVAAAGRTKGRGPLYELVGTEKMLLGLGEESHERGFWGRW